MNGTTLLEAESVALRRMCATAERERDEARRERDALLAVIRRKEPWTDAWIPNDTPAMFALSPTAAPKEEG